jgi:cyanophycin synthetase
LRVPEREKVKAVPKQIVLFSLDEMNPHIQKHLKENGTVYFRRGNWIIEAMSGGRHMLIKIDSIPATMNGTAEFQIANSLAAIAACRACGLWLQNVSRLQTFQNNVANNPGRNNLYKVGRGGYALIDYGHNAGAFAAICKMAAGWRDKTVTGIIGVPGDRDDRIIKEAASIAARGFHRIIIKEDHDLRGRAPGEVARLLCETVNREAPDRRCTIVLDEVQAFSDALGEIQENEVVVIFYDKLEPILKVLNEHQAMPVAGFEKTSVKMPEGAMV